MSSIKSLTLKKINMFGDFCLRIKSSWKKYCCWHDYRLDRWRFNAGKGIGYICEKCHKYSERN